jgi:hypothetical protein
MSRLYVLFLILALTLPFDAAASASPPFSDAEQALEDYLEQERAPAAKIAAFDHLERTWTVLRWDGSCLHREAGPTERPEIALRADEQLRTFVINTNPLVFTVDRTATSQVNIDALANLQRLASGLGAIAGATVMTRNANVLFRAFKPFEDRGDLRMTEFLTSSDPFFPAPAKIPPSFIKLREVYLLYLAALEPVAARLEPRLLSPVAKAAADITQSLRRAQSDRLLPWLQAIESSVPAANRPGFTPDLDLREIAGQFNTLEEETVRLSGIELPCRASSEQLRTMLAIKRAPFTAEGALAQRDRYFAAARALARGLQENDRCPGLLVEATSTLVLWLREHPPTTSGLSETESWLLNDLHDHVSSYLEQAQRFAGALDSARTLAASEPTAAATVARIGQFQERRARLGELDPAVGVLPVPRSSFPGRTVRWSRKRTDTVEVALDESLEDDLTLRHPETATTTFEVRRAFSDGLEADFALTRTDLFSPTYESKDIDGMDGGASRIQETARDTRSGKVAMMAAYRFPLGLGFAVGPQLGAGIDLDDAALFYGVSLRWRFLALGYGRTRQKVTVLRGQEVGQELAEGVSLRTEDAFRTEPYWSLAITITDLPFFEPQD